MGGAAAAAAAEGAGEAEAEAEAVAASPKLLLSSELCRGRLPEGGRPIKGGGKRMAAPAEGRLGGGGTRTLTLLTLPALPWEVVEDTESTLVRWRFLPLLLLLLLLCCGRPLC